MVKKCKLKTQKLYFIRYERSKEFRKALPSLSGRDVVCAKSKESAKSKWRRNFPLSPKPKVISATEVKD